jgi:hypothetical protein
MVHCTGHAAFPVAAMEMLTSALLPAALRKSAAMAPHTWQDPCCEQIGVVELSVNDLGGIVYRSREREIAADLGSLRGTTHLHDVDLRGG